MQRTDQFRPATLDRGLAQPRQVREPFGGHAPDRFLRRIGQRPPGVRIGAAVLAVRQRVPQGDPVGRRRDAQGGGGIGIGEPGDQAQQQRGARTAAQRRQGGEWPFPARRGRWRAQLRRGEQGAPEQPRPVRERLCEGMVPELAQGNGEGLFRAQGIAHQQLGEDRPSALDATQESGQGGRSVGVGQGGIGHRQGVLTAA